MSCPSGKRPYRNRQQAVRGLLRCRFDRRGRLRRDSNRNERGAYQCRLCSRWHLTHYAGAEVDLGIDMEKAS